MPMMVKPMAIMLMLMLMPSAVLIAMQLPRRQREAPVITLQQACRGESWPLMLRRAKPQCNRSVPQLALPQPRCLPLARAAHPLLRLSPRLKLEKRLLLLFQLLIKLPAPPQPGRQKLVPRLPRSRQSSQLERLLLLLRVRKLAHHPPVQALSLPLLLLPRRLLPRLQQREPWPLSQHHHHHHQRLRLRRRQRWQSLPRRTLRSSHLEPLTQALLIQRRQLRRRVRRSSSLLLLLAYLPWAVVQQAPVPVACL